MADVFKIQNLLMFIIIPTNAHVSGIKLVLSDFILILYYLHVH